MARAAPSLAPRPPWAWAFAGIAIGLLLACLLFAPARWLAGPLERASSGRLLLADARGTVWRGSAQLMLSGGAGSTDSAALPTRVDWKLRPRWDGLLAQVESACCTTAPVELRVPGRLVEGWTMVDGSADVPPPSPVDTTGPDQILTLVPYGSAKLRITAFPVTAPTRH